MSLVPQNECEKPTCPPGYKVIEKKIRKPHKYSSRYAEYRYGGGSSGVKSTKGGNSGVKGTKGGNYGVKGGNNKGGNREINGIKGGKENYQEENKK